MTLKEFRVTIPVSFVAVQYVWARTPEEAEQTAVNAYRDMSEETRIEMLGAGLLLEQSGDGGVIGEPMTEVTESEARS